MNTNNIAPPPPAPTTQAELKDHRRRLRADEAARAVLELSLAFGRLGVHGEPEQIAAAAAIYAGIVAGERNP